MPVKRYNGSDWEVISGVGLQGPAGADGTAPLSTKGQLLTRTSSAVTAIGVGANNTVLTADSSTATGLKWAAPSASAANYSLLNAGGTNLSGSSSVTISGISGWNSIMVLANDVSAGGTFEYVAFQFNGDTANNYTNFGLTLSNPSSYSTDVVSRIDELNADDFKVYRTSGSATSIGDACITMTGANSAGIKIIQGVGAATAGGDQNQQSFISQGLYRGTSTISSVTIKTASNFDNGKIYVYGSAV